MLGTGRISGEKGQSGKQMMPWDECPGENDQGALAERVGADLGRIVKNLSEGESSLGGRVKDAGKSLPGRGNSHCEHQRP